MKRLFFILLLPLTLLGQTQPQQMMLNMPAKSTASGGGDVTAGLQLWWKFDEGTGTTAADSSGNGFTGTLEDGVGWVTGKVGPFATSYANSGGGSDPFCVQNLAISFSGDWTISFWYNGVSTGIVNYAVTTTTTGTGIYVGGSYVSGQWGFYDGTTTFEVGTIPSSTWTFLTVTKSGTTYSFYQNGAFINSDTQISLNVTQFIAGSRQGILGISGNLDDMRLYNRALSSAEASQLYLHY